MVAEWIRKISENAFEWINRDGVPDWSKNILSSFWAFLSGLISAALGYFLPIRNIVHLLVLFFTLDVIFGFWAAKKLRKERFSAKIIWNTTVPRLVLSLIAVIGAYLWDTEYGQNVVATYKIIGWFLTGILFFNILQNGYNITNWTAFKSIGEFVKDKLSAKTGINFENNKNGNN